MKPKPRLLGVFVLFFDEILILLMMNQTTNYTLLIVHLWITTRIIIIDIFIWALNFFFNNQF